MNLTDTSPFTEACGLKTPIDLRILRDDGTVLAEGELELPCALVGRDNVCEVTLLEADISLRHACIQAVGGRVLLADIGSRLGVSYGNERQPFVWLTPTTPVFLGSFRITLRRPLFVRPTIPDLSPFLPQSPSTDALPRVGVRFLNGKSIKTEWIVNRAVTFVGCAQDCKISLGADDIAPYHCYFVLTPQGLWVVDLLTEVGIRVNGEPVRYARLNTGDQLQVGRFRLGFQYLDEAPVSVVLTSAPQRVPVVTAAPAISAPQIHPNVVPQLPDFTAALAPLMNAPAIANDPSIAPLIHQFAVAQGQMMEQFQQSMVMVMNMFGQMHREQMDSMQSELARMAELNTEMQKLQAQMADQSNPVIALPQENNPLSQAVNSAVSEESASQHNWVYERITALQKERQTIWQRLFGMMAPKVAGN